MKKDLLKLTFLVLLASLAVRLAAVTSLNDGLLAHYPLDGNAQDTSVNAKHGVTSCVSAADHNGNIGKALRFETGKAVTTPALNYSTTGKVTYCAWVKAFSFPSEYPKISSLMGTWDNYSKCLLRIGDADIDNNKPQFIVGDYKLTGSKGLEINKYYFIAATFDGNFARIYIDGKLDACAFVGAFTFGVSPEFYIGHGYNDRYLNGNIDDVRIYNRCLSADEVEVLYNRNISMHSISDSTYVAGMETTLSWYFNQDTITSIGLQYSTDNGTNWIPIASGLTGNIYKWTVPQTTSNTLAFQVYNTDKPTEKAEVLSQKIITKFNNLYVKLPLRGNTLDEMGVVNALSFNVDFEDGNILGRQVARMTKANPYIKLNNTQIGGETTISVWVKCNNPNANYARIFDFSNGASSNNVLLGFNGTTGNMFAEIFSGAASSGQVYTSAVFPVKKWVHVSVVYRADGQTSIYWDGILQGSAKLIPIPQVSRSENLIGKSAWTSDAQFTGYMSDFRIYKRALTSQEITALAKPLIKFNELDRSVFFKNDLIKLNYSFNSDSIHSLNLSYSIDSGASWTTIASGITASEYHWTIPFDTAKHLFFKIYDESNPTRYSIYDDLSVVEKASLFRYYLPFNGNAHNILDTAKVTSVNITYVADRFGNPNSAADFNGTDAYVSLPAKKLGGEFSLSTWIYSRNPNALWSRCFDFSNGNGNDDICSSFESTNGNMLFVVSNGAGLIRINEQFPKNKWMHVAYTINCRGWGKIYWNGKLKAEGQMIPIPDVNRTLNYIGKSGYASDALFNGTMDAFRVYNRALTTDEIISLYYEGYNLKFVDEQDSLFRTLQQATLKWFRNTDSITSVNVKYSINNGQTWSIISEAVTVDSAIWTTPSSSNHNVIVKIENAAKPNEFIQKKFSVVSAKELGLRLWLPLNGNSKDTSVYLMSVTSPKSKYTTDRFNKANSCFGNDSSAVQINNPLNIEEYTIQGWFKTTGRLKNGKYGYLFGWYDLYLGFGYYAPGKLILDYWYNGGNHVNFTSTDTLNDDKWHFYAVTNDASGLKLYIDTAMVFSSEYRCNSIANELMYVGSDYIEEDDIYNPFAGSLDEFKVYDHALTASELKEENCKRNFILNAGNDIAVCKGQSVTLNATTNGSSYEWLFAGVQNGVSFVPEQTSDYVVSGNFDYNCFVKDTVVVAVNALPTINVGPDLTVCKGSSFNLSAMSDGSVVWDNSISNGASISPLVNATYIATATSTHNCVNKDTLNVVVNSIPTINAGNDISVCNGGNITLNAISDGSITWSNSVENGIQFTPSASAFYIATAKNANNCTNKDTVEVKVSELPKINAGKDISICKGKSIVLDAMTSGSVTWNNGVVNGIAFVPLNTDDYIVTLTDINGCIASDTVRVTLEECSENNLNEASESLLKIYPTVTKNKVFIESRETIKTVQIFNSRGQSINCKLTNGYIDLSAVPSGIYLLKIQSKMGWKTNKVVKY